MFLLVKEAIKWINSFFDKTPNFSLTELMTQIANKAIWMSAEEIIAEHPDIIRSFRNLLIDKRKARDETPLKPQWDKVAIQLGSYCLNQKNISDALLFFQMSSPPPGMIPLSAEQMIKKYPQIVLDLEHLPNEAILKKKWFIICEALGKYYFDLGEHRKAVIYYQKLPQCGKICFAFEEYFINQGEYENALYYYKNIPAYSEYAKRGSLKLFELGNYALLTLNDRKFASNCFHALLQDPDYEKDAKILLKLAQNTNEEVITLGMLNTMKKINDNEIGLDNPLGEEESTEQKNPVSNTQSQRRCSLDSISNITKTDIKELGSNKLDKSSIEVKNESHEATKKSEFWNRIQLLVEECSKKLESYKKYYEKSNWGKTTYERRLQNIRDLTNELRHPANSLKYYSDNDLLLLCQKIFFGESKYSWFRKLIVGLKDVLNDVNKGRLRPILKFDKQMHNEIVQKNQLILEYTQREKKEYRETYNELLNKNLELHEKSYELEKKLKEQEEDFDIKLQNQELSFQKELKNQELNFQKELGEKLQNQELSFQKELKNQELSFQKELGEKLQNQELNFQKELGEKLEDQKQNFEKLFEKMQKNINELSLTVNNKVSSSVEENYENSPYTKPVQIPSNSVLVFPSKENSLTNRETQFSFDNTDKQSFFSKQGSKIPNTLPNQTSRSLLKNKGSFILEQTKSLLKKLSCYELNYDIEDAEEQIKYWESLDKQKPLNRSQKEELLELFYELEIELNSANNTSNKGTALI